MILLLRQRLFTLLRIPVKVHLQRKNICISNPRVSLNNRLRHIGSLGGKESHFRLKDNVKSDFSLIYRAPMESYISVAKNISTITASAIALLAANHFVNDKKIIPIDIQMAGLVTKENDIWYFAAGFILISIAIRVLVAKYPLRIYNNENRYIAVYGSQLPFRYVKHHFVQSEVAPTQNILNPWSSSMFRFRNRTSVLLAKYFKTPADFNKLVGFK